MAAEFKLSTLLGGINRFVGEAGPNQAIDALDVWNYKSRLMRRPAFRSIAHGLPSFIPSGQTHIKIEAPFNTFTDITDWVPSVAPGDFGGLSGRLWLGCDQAFDGFEWPIQELPNALTNNCRIALKYRTTDLSLNKIYDPIDTTIGNLEDWTTTLTKYGTFAWHRSVFTNWTATTLNGVTAFWIAVDLSLVPAVPGNVSTAIDFPATSGDLQVDKPGIRCFLLSPINGLIPVHSGNGNKHLLIGSDRRPDKFGELGGQLYVVNHPRWPGEQARLVEAEGEAVFGRVTYPAWDGGGGAGTIGSATDEILTKSNQTYEWMGGTGTHPISQFDGAPITSGVAITGSTAAHINVAGFNDDRYVGLVLRMTSGARTTQEREIYNVSVTGLDLSEALLGAPANGDTFQIRTPPAKLRTIEGGIEYPIDVNTAHTVTVTTARKYEPPLASSDITEFVNFEIFRDCPWSLRPGNFWSAIFDSITLKVLLVNGANQILEYDGRRFRRLTALFDDTEGAIGAAAVILWRGNLQDTATKLNRLDVIAGSLLHGEPPLAKLLVDFNGRLVALRNDDIIQWSAAGVDNNIWPYLYETTIRDSESNKPIGMGVLHDNLYVWTKTSIFFSPQADELGLLAFRTIAQGIGFAGHQCVTKAVVGNTACFIGAAPDGLILFDGTSVTYLIDDWSRVLNGGVNDRLLENAVSGFWFQENTFFLALAGKGSSTNNRMLVLNTRTQACYVWSCPWGGCTAIARQFDERGHEKMLFGFADGHVAELVWGPSDAGVAIEGFARSSETEPLEGHTFAPLAIMLSIQDNGSHDTTIRMFLNNSEATTGEVTQSFDDNSSKLDATDVNFDEVSFAKDRFVTRRIPASAGSSGESFSFEISGTNQFEFISARLLLAEKGNRNAQ